MAKPVKPVPEGYRTVTPYLIIRGADRAIDFYRKAFGAREVTRMLGPDGKTISHAEICIGDSMVMLSEENLDWGSKSPETLGGSAASVFLYVEDVDAVQRQALAAGAQEITPVTDMFWGDRFGQVKDPFGHTWSIATHKADLTPEETQKAALEFFAQMAAHKQGA